MIPIITVVDETKCNFDILCECGNSAAGSIFTGKNHMERIPRVKKFVCSNCNLEVILLIKNNKKAEEPKIALERIKEIGEDFVF